MRVVDASGQVLGRFCSHVAKDLLQGEEIAVVNAEHAVITGSPESILREYQHKRRVGSQRKGPYFPRRSDRILKRTVRGMLPYQRPRGKEALRRLRVYTGVPEGLEVSADEEASAGVEGTTTTYITLGELARLLGGTA